MKEVFYKNLAFDAFNKLRKNLLLFVPDILFLLITIVLTLIFAYFNNLFGIVSASAGAGFEEIIQNFADKLLKDMPTLIRFIGSLAVLIFLNVIFGISLTVIKFTYVRDILNGKKFNLKRILTDSAFYFFPVIFVKLIVLFLFLLPVPFLGFAVLKFPASLAFMAILLILIWIFLRIILFFVFPALYLEKGKRSSLRAIKRSIRFFFRHPEHTVIVLLIIVLVSLAFNVAFNLFYSGAGLISGWTLFVIALVYGIFRFLIGVGISLWGLLLNFLGYRIKP